MPYLNHTILIAYGPRADAEHLLSNLSDVLEAAGYDLSHPPQFCTSDTAKTYLTIQFTEPQNDPFGGMDVIIAQYPSLRFLIAKSCEAEYFKTTVVRHRHGLGFNASIVDDTYKRQLPPFRNSRASVELALDLYEDVASDPDLAQAFELVGYPLERLQQFMAPPT